MMLRLAKRTQLRGLWGHLKRLHGDERGAEGLEKLLIFAAIILPLLGLLIFFRKEVKEWVNDIWEKAKGEADEDESDYFGN